MTKKAHRKIQGWLIGASVALFVVLYLVRGVEGFTHPVADPPIQPVLFRSDGGDPEKYGIGTFEFSKLFNVSRGTILHGEPINPKVVGEQFSPGVNITDIEIQRPYVYLALAGAAPEFTIIDITNPHTPNNLAVLSLGPSPAKKLEVEGKYAYVILDEGTEENEMIRKIDISNPSLPVVVGGTTLSDDPEMPTNTEPVDIEIAGRYGVVAFDDGTIATIDLFNANPGTDELNVVASVSVGSTPVKLKNSGKFVYAVLDRSSGTDFAVINMNDAENPQLITELSLLGNIPSDIDIEGSFAYITFATMTDIGIVDINDPTNPTLVYAPSAGTLPEPANEIKVAGRYAYVTLVDEADAMNELRIIDVQDWTAPKIVGGESFDSNIPITTATPNHLVLEGRYAYIAGQNAMKVIDITGVETATLSAHALEVGVLSIHNNLKINDMLRVRGNSTIAGDAYIAGDTTFMGDLYVGGTISATMKNFKINHPLDPENKILRHSSIESNEAKNIYDGIAELNRNGEARVTFPDYFEALNTNFRYQLTAIDGKPAPNLYVKKEIENNKFTIAGGTPFGRISWQVTGVRHDAYIRANPVIVEEDKKIEGYIYPELYE
jgi:hypothetical protein